MPRGDGRPWPVSVLGIDHVQVAAPPGCEEEARAFYGGLLGMEELPKPEPLRARGGCWFRAGAQELHVGVEEPFAPARKAHPGLVVADLDALAAGSRGRRRRRCERRCARIAGRRPAASCTTRSATGSSSVAGTNRCSARYPIRLLMDTRQLAAFCAVVERRSFSQAAERLGVTQPAVSLQIRALEKRLGTQLLDRSGRRVEPTEAGLRLYRGAQRLLALEEQVVAEVAEEGERGARRDVRDRRVDRARRDRAVAAALRVRGRCTRRCTSCCGSSTRRRSSSASPTASSSSASSARRARHRGVVFEPFFRDEVILACPPGHPFAGRTITLDELRGRALIVMQEGAGVRQLIEDELRASARACATSTSGSSSGCRSR